MSSETAAKKTKMAKSLEQLKALTVIVADTGEFEGIFFYFQVLRIKCNTMTQLDYRFFAKKKNYTIDKKRWSLVLNNIER